MKNIRKKMQGNPFWKELVNNSIWSFLGDSISSVLGLVVTILLIQYIGSDSYGILILGQTYSLIIDIAINVQSWKGVIRFGQRALVKNDIPRLNSYIKLGTVLDTVTAIIAGIVSLLIAPLIGHILGWDDNLILCASIFSFTIFSHFSGTTIGILRILNKFNLLALQKFISALIKILAIVGIFILKGSITLVQATIIYAITDIIGNLLLVFFAYNEYRKKYGLKNFISAKYPADSKDFLSFTFWGTISEIVDIPVNYIDVFITSMLGNSLVAIYKVFKQIAGIFQKVSSPIQQSILPQFSQLSAENEEKRGYEIVKKIHKTSILIMLPIAIIAGLSSIIWLNIIYGEAYASQWYNLLFLLVIQSYALSYAAIHPYFLSIGQSKRSAYYVFVSNILYLILSISLVNTIGIAGILVALSLQATLVIFLKKSYIEKEIIKKTTKMSAIVIGGEHHNTLGVIRALGRENIFPSVILTTNTKYVSVKKSRYINKCICVKDNEKEIINAINILLEKTDKIKPVLIPTSDYAALIIDKHFNELKNKCYLPSIDNKQGNIEKYMDKYNQFTYVQKLKIKTPETFKVNLTNELNLLKFKKYPYIIKPLISAINGSKDNMRICKNKEELIQGISELKNEKINSVLIQEYIQYDYEMNLIGCSYNGNVIVPSAIQKCRRYPTGYGPLSLAQMVKIPKEAKSFIRIIKELKVNALFDLEVFCKDNEFTLNEINFRNSGNTYAYTYDGINLPYLYMKLANGKKIDDQKKEISKEFFFRDENGERRQLLHGNISLREFIHARRKSVGLAYDTRDIKPDIYRWIYAFKKRIFRRK